MILICELCGEQFEGYKGQRFCSNECKNKHVSFYRKQKNIEVYLQSPKLCKKCGNIIPYEKRNNEFCSKSCSNSYTNSHRVRRPWTEEQKSKVRKNQEGRYFCKYCGKLIKTHSSICSNCKPYVRRLKTFTKFGLNDGSLSDRYNKLKEIIYQDYFENFQSLEMISNSYDVDLTIVYDIINKEFGGCRDSSESVLLAIRKGRLDPEIGLNSIKNYSFVSGKHKSWDGKIYCYRSSWEEQYMKELDEKKINYQYEPFRVEYFDSKRNVMRYAIPDFLLLDSNEIIEIKSSYTIKNQVQEMKDKFKSYKNLGYQPKLLLDWVFVDVNDLNEENFSYM